MVNLAKSLAESLQSIVNSAKGIADSLQSIVDSAKSTAHAKKKLPAKYAQKLFLF